MLFAAVTLFDYLIGGEKQLGRHRQPQCFCSLEIDGKFECGRLHDGDIAGLYHAPKLDDIIASSQELMRVGGGI